MQLSEDSPSVKVAEILSETQSKLLKIGLLIVGLGVLAKITISYTNFW